MGSIGANVKPAYTLTIQNTILRNYKDNEALGNYLTTLGRPLKQTEFDYKQYYVGSRIAGGMQYGYRVVPPKGFPPILSYDTYATKAGAKNAVKDFVNSYNDWYKNNAK